MKNLVKRFGQFVNEGGDNSHGVEWSPNVRDNDMLLKGEQEDAPEQCEKGCKKFDDNGECIECGHMDPNYEYEDEDDFIAAEIEEMRGKANRNRKEPEKFLFKNISPTLKVLIHQMIEKMESKFDEEEINVSTGELKRFVAGDSRFTENEISDQLSRILRMLA